MNHSNKQERPIVRFPSRGNASFFDAVKAGVDQYFKSNDLSPYGNINMWVKAAVMLLLYLGPYVCIITGVGDSHVWLFLGLWFLMGLGMVGIGTAIMHDANHGALSKHKKVNTVVGHLIELIGGYSVTWKIQHNILHHTYTNIEGLDDDIDSNALLRFSPHRPLYWFHRYQFIYAWFLYTLLTLFWMSAKDFIQLYNYRRYGLLRKQRISFKKAMLQASLLCIFYHAYALVLPLIFSGMPWYTILSGYLLMHVTAGFALSCIFQPSHIVETSAFEQPVEESGEPHMKNSWAIHQVLNTADYAPRNRFISWFIGGLNYQIEHHLFPGICHVHYRKISLIVKNAARTYGLPYHVHPTFLKALFAHAKMLKQLGRK
ncbi:acyl-CoA desaturase [Chitinophaga sp. MM2321]|uniref:fatty acid desaturase family protein n=1 Tax=Chitinophaga sp. MM2321 TaxID=3137178 RepID=UPI0032D57A79